VTDQLLMETLRDWGEETRVPPDLADRVLISRAATRRRRVVPLVAAVAAAAAVVAGLGIAWPWVAPGEKTFIVGSMQVSADTGALPPRQLIAAGDVAVGALWRVRREESAGAGSLRTLRRSWWIYDSGADRYVHTDWTWADVAPGLKSAAGLVGALPSSRLEILDTVTGRTIRTIDLRHPVASVAFSPDGATLLATAYDQNPDVVASVTPPSPRSGFYIIDVASGAASFHPLLPNGSYTPRQDLLWSSDGTRVRDIRTSHETQEYFYELDGQPSTAPDGPRDNVEPGTWGPLTSPDGKLTVTRQAGLPTEVTDNANGRVYRQDLVQLLAWADNDHVVGLDCDSPCRGAAEFHNALVMSSVDGSHAVPLTARNNTDDYREVWHWVLTGR
jgi:hypothetical protein